MSITDPLITILSSSSKESKGHTAQELAKAAGVPVSQVNRTIRKLYDEGKLEVGCKDVAIITGVIRKIPSYWMKEKP